jgi:glycosyltransferase involved in cell wall biosynthesis
MKVLLLVTGFPSQRNAQSGIFNLRSARRLVDIAEITVVHVRGWRPGVPKVEIERDGALTIRRITVPQIRFGSFFATSMLWLNVRSMIQRGWPMVRDLLPFQDVIHSVGAVSAGLVGSDWSKRSGSAHVVQVIGDDLNIRLPRLVDSGWTGWQRHLDGAACNSDALREKLLSFYPSLKNVRTVRRGVDLGEFCPADQGDGDIGEGAGVRFLFVGGFPLDQLFHGNLKGGNTLLAAWAAADERGIGSHASLVIAGPESDAPVIETWRSRLKHPESVQIAGTIPPREMPNFLKRCDAVLIPSMLEGLPNVAMEAAASAKPVIARLTGGLPEIVQHERTGLLFESAKPEDWAEILLNCVRDRDHLKTMGERARTFAEAHLSSRNYPIAMREIYEEAVARRKKRISSLV